MSSFIKNFRQNSNEAFIPKSVLEEMNANNIYGMKYVYSNEDEMYVLVPNSDKIIMKIQDFKIKDLDKILQKLDSDTYTMNDLLNYSYNAQQPLVLIPNDGFKQFINGQEFRMSELFIGGVKISDEYKGTFYIEPMKMDESITLKIGSKNNQREITFNRIPNDSVYTLRFKSNENDIVKIEYSVNTRKNKLKFYFNLNLSQITCAKQLYDAITYLRDIFDNGLMIFDKKIPIENFTNSLNITESLIDVWNKIIKLEEKLNIEFEIGDGSLTEKNYKDILLLYSSIVENKPLRENISVNYISYNYDDETDKTINKLKEELKNGLKKDIYLEHEVIFKCELFNRSLSFNGIIGFFNLKISKIDTSKDDKSHYIYMENDLDNQTYSSTFLFQDDNDLEKFKISENHIKVLKDAKIYSFSFEEDKN